MRDMSLETDKNGHFQKSEGSRSMRNKAEGLKEVGLQACQKSGGLSG